MTKKDSRVPPKNRIVRLKKEAASITLYQWLSLSVSLLGALSLVFIVVQTTLLRAQTQILSEQTSKATENMQASMYATIATHTFEMDRLFIEHPNLRPYFYGGKDIDEKDKDYDLVIAIAEHQLDYFDATWTQLGYIPDDADKEEDRETWNRYFLDSFANSPILCKRFNMNRSWYMNSLAQKADEGCKKDLAMVSEAPHLPASSSKSSANP